ncbi:MAG: radical SAM protein [Anaerolineales bacterium]|nr:radical SAM protein [Anaerolineales bacterium]
MIAFGPVPSRRLGRSLGINNIPPKICTYSCVYCQLGRTIKMQIERQPFYRPDEILGVVRDKVTSALDQGEAIDYLSFVPDGEPTLDLNLGVEISALRELGTRIAVISNASLIWRDDVRADLMTADWVSLKVDAVRLPTWRRIDRPHGGLTRQAILGGMRTFAVDFKGEFVTETMLVKGVNDTEDDLVEIAEFLGEIQPDIAYISIPTRPPAEDWVRAAEEGAINLAYQLVGEQVNQVELLLGYEGNAFSASGDAEEDILSITAVHPMREDAVRQLLIEAGSSWDLVNDLIQQGKLVELQYLGKRFYLRRVLAHIDKGF